MKKIKVLLLMGGGGAEHEVSLSSGQEVLKNMDLGRYDVVPMVVENKQVEIDKIKEINPEIVFIVIHGDVGEDGVIQKILEDVGIKFVGCGSQASALGIDKTKFKELVEQDGLLVPKGIEVKKDEMVDLEKLKLWGNKWVIKPATKGSSVGVSIIDDLKKLDGALELAFKYDDRVIVEEFVGGVEVSCGVLGNKNPTALPVIEICPKNSFFDYEAKYTIGKCEEIVPARLSNEVTKKIQEYSVKVFELMGGRGFARVDFIVKGDQPVLLEINTIPGMTPNSLLPKEARAIGISYPQLLDRIIELALEE